MWCAVSVSVCTIFDCHPASDPRDGRCIGWSHALEAVMGPSHAASAGCRWLSNVADFLSPLPARPADRRQSGAALVLAGRRWAYASGAYPAFGDKKKEAVVPKRGGERTYTSSVRRPAGRGYWVSTTSEDHGRPEAFQADRTRRRDRRQTMEPRPCRVLTLREENGVVGSRSFRSGLGKFVAKHRSFPFTSSR